MLLKHFKIKQKKYSFVTNLISIQFYLKVLENFKIFRKFQNFFKQHVAQHFLTY